MNDLMDKLRTLTYPCYFVAHGPARDYRTKFRCEHHGVFRSGMVSNAEEAFGLIDGANYPGHIHEMDLIAIGIDEEGTLKETTI